MTGTLRIAIVGYGIAGISAAIFLRRLGHEVIHFERAAVPSIRWRWSAPERDRH